MRFISWIFFTFLPLTLLISQNSVEQAIPVQARRIQDRQILPGQRINSKPSQQIRKAIRINKKTTKTYRPKASPKPSVPKPLEITKKTEKTGTETTQDKHLNSAHFLYNQKVYDLALKEYTKFLEKYPGDKATREVSYFLANCYLGLKKIDRAKIIYSELVDKYRKGKYVALSAQTLGSIYFFEKKYKSSTYYYNLAKNNTKSSDTKNSITLSLSNSYFKQNKLKQAERELKNLISEKSIQNKQYYEAILLLGNVYLKSNKFEKVEKLFQVTLDKNKGEIPSSVNNKIKIRLATLASKQNNFRKAISHLTNISNIDNLSYDWQKLFFKLTFLCQKNLEKYSDMTLFFEEHRKFFMNDPYFAFEAATAYRKVKNYLSAISIYNELMAKNPETNIEQRASYEKLESLYSQKVPNITKHIDYFIQIARSTNFKESYIDKAKFLKAEFFFRANNFLMAISIYGDIKIDNLEEKIKPLYVYNYAWSLSNTDDKPKAVQKFTEFIDDYSAHPYVISALSKRGMCYSSMHDYHASMRDFESITKRSKDKKYLEFAYLQLGRIRGQLQNVKGMIKAFEQIIEKFPYSKFVAEANYWVGWGNYELKEYENSIFYLEQARNKNIKKYGNRASSRILNCYYFLEDNENLVKEINYYQENFPASDINKNILEWLGRTLYDNENYEGANKYLNLASTPDEPQNTKASIWYFLGLSQEKLNLFEEAIITYSNYMDSLKDKKASYKAHGLISRSRAYLGFQDSKNAKEDIMNALQLQKEGSLNAEAQILLGDIYSFDEKFDEAAKTYEKIALIFDDPNLTPLSHAKAIIAWNKLGNKEKVNQNKKILQEKYPLFDYTTVRIPKRKRTS